MEFYKPNEDAANRFDQAFREGLGNAEVPPSHGVWAGIEAELDAIQPATNPGTNWWYPSVAMLLIFGLLINTALLVEMKLIGDQTDDGILVSVENDAFPFFIDKENQDETPEHLPQLMGFFPADFPFGINGFGFEKETNNGLRLEGLKRSYGDIITPNLKTDLNWNFPNANQVNNVAAIGRHKNTTKEPSTISIPATLSREVETATDKLFVSTDESFILASLIEDDAEEKFKERMAARKAERALHNSMIPIKGFSFGATASANNTWMILKANSHDRSLGENLEYKMDFGAAYGVAMAYDFSTRFGIQADYIINSSQGQKYSAELKENRVDGSLDLRYTQVPVLLKYKWAKLSKRTEKPRVMNYVFGLQYSHLKSATINTNGFATNGESKFNKNELGLAFGLDYDIFITKNLFMSLGARGTLSSDIKSFPLIINDENQNPYNFLLGINASFKYLIHKS